MTALEVIKSKGYNPFKTKMVKKNNMYMVYSPENKLIVQFKYSVDGKHIIIKK